MSTPKTIWFVWWHDSKLRKWRMLERWYPERADALMVKEHIQNQNPRGKTKIVQYIRKAAP